MTEAPLLVPQKRFQYLCDKLVEERRKSRRGNIASAEGNLEIIDGVPIPSLSHRSRETFAIPLRKRHCDPFWLQPGNGAPPSLSRIDNLVEIFQPDKTVRRNCLNVEEPFPHFLADKFTNLNAIIPNLG